MVVTAQLLLHGLLDADLGTVGEAEGSTKHRIASLRHVIAYDRLEDVPRIDVLVGLVAGVQPGHLACHLERGGVLAQPQYRGHSGPGDLLQLVGVEHDDALIVIDIDDRGSPIHLHDGGMGILA